MDVSSLGTGLVMSDFISLYLTMVFQYCILGYFRGGFIFTNFASQTSRKFPLHFMPIYCSENIRKIMKLSPLEFLHLHVMSSKTAKMYLYAKMMAYMCIQYLESTLHKLVVATSNKPRTSFQVVRNNLC